MENFKQEFELRVDWEILSEFTLTAQIGRTLEKLQEMETATDSEIAKLRKNLDDLIVKA